MKTKSFIMAVAAFALGSSAFAQEVNTPARNTTFVSDPVSSHWYIELGNNFAISDQPWVDGPKLKDRIAYFNPTISVGKWFNPYFSTRLKFTGGEQILFRNYDEMAVGMANPIKHKASYVNGNIDFMFDAINYFTKYREDRVFHVIPYVGVGLSYIGKYTGDFYHGNKDTFRPTVEAGIQFKCRLAKVVDLNVEANSVASRERVFNSDYKMMAEDGTNAYTLGLLSGVQVGLTFHLGKKEFTPIVPMDHELINGLNSELNKLRAQHEELAKRPESCPDAPEVKVSKVVLGNVVYFRINSAKIDPNQVINVYNIAQWMKGNTENISLVGYADRQTGTSEYNMKLSQRRAEAVKDMLVKKYGISEDRIKTSWEGSEVQPYQENIWNRVVLMNAEVE